MFHYTWRPYPSNQLPCESTKVAISTWATLFLMGDCGKGPGCWRKLPHHWSIECWLERAWFLGEGWGWDSNDGGKFRWQTCLYVNNDVTNRRGSSFHTVMQVRITHGSFDAGLSPNTNHVHLTQSSLSWASNTSTATVTNWEFSKTPCKTLKHPQVQSPFLLPCLSPQSANPAPAFGQRPTIFGLRHFGEPLLLLQAQTHIVHGIGGRHSPEVGPSHRGLTGLRLSCAERQTKRPKEKLRERPRAKSPCKSQNSWDMRMCQFSQASNFKKLKHKCWGCKHSFQHKKW